MKFRHLFWRDKVSILESQLEQVPGKLPQRGHGIIHAAGLSFVLLKNAVCAWFIWQKQIWKPFFHMVLVVPKITFLRVVHISKTSFIADKSVYPVSNGYLLQSLSPSFGKGRVREDIVS